MIKSWRQSHGNLGWGRGQNEKSIVREIREIKMGT